MHYNPDAITSIHFDCNTNEDAEKESTAQASPIATEPMDTEPMDTEPMATEPEEEIKTD